MSIKVLYFVTEDWYFLSHRLPLALAVKNHGCEVVLVTRTSESSSRIQDSGIRVISLKHLRRSSMNPFREILALIELFRIYRRERPDLTHHVAIKPAIYGTLIAKLLGIQGTVNALGGMGLVFSANKKVYAFLRVGLRGGFRSLFCGLQNRMIVQNQHDFDYLSSALQHGTNNVRLIRSAGVDLQQYAPKPFLSRPPIVMLASRMIMDKGICEFIEAARILKDGGVQAKFVLVGSPDSENPNSIPESSLLEWSKTGVVEWWGYSSDMPHTLSKASIVCLPSYYGEGVPKILIEAMACARPIVTTDMPGCRDLVQPMRNGLLVRPRDAQHLANALGQLLSDLPSLAVMGFEGRSIAEERYSLSQVVAETLDVYRELVTL